MITAVHLEMKRDGTSDNHKKENKKWTVQNLLFLHKTYC